MKANFEDPQRNYHLTITPDDENEALELARWDNCIVTAKFDFNFRGSASESTLHLIKEI